MAYKEQVYAEIIRRGVERGYHVVAEFDWVRNDGRLFHFDLAWLGVPENKRPVPLECIWMVKAVFEIEGCNNNDPRHVENAAIIHALGIPYKVALYHQSVLRNLIAPNFILKHSNRINRLYLGEISKNKERDWQSIVIDGRHMMAQINNEDPFWIPNGL